MWNTANEAYLESRVLSADPLELVRLLYQAALASIRDARRHLAEGNIAERARAISKTWSIVIELSSSLNHERGGEISTRLMALYEYMLQRLLEANLTQADAPLAEVLSLLSTLSEAWAETGTFPAPEDAAASAWSAPEPASAHASQAWSL